ncbi:MAG: elongation factor P maturation arginine rhamnosyltransferase EarP [Burkholderiales bacterium]|nr:elongation factor P maturation arginine rhamnosyltransferase EarP [Burkholderiales bacterium]
MRWDLFCRVVDNYGDIGVCWRLAADLAERGEQLRLWVDDSTPLTWMAPDGAAGVEVVRWTAGAAAALEPGAVVIEAFGCDPPAEFVARMAARLRPPCWINLEYLSAEPYVERCHGLPSPQAAGPGRGLRKWFYYPGFTAGSGGLIRERGLMRDRAAFDPAAWLAVHGLAPRPGERLVSLFCYPTAPLAELLPRLAQQPTALLLAPGAAQQLARATPGPWPTMLRRVELPWLTQPAYDRLLWAGDLNLVRGEDSFVRAIWGGAPFVWQIYPQADGAHAAKLDAFLGRYLERAEAHLAASIRALWQAWNGLGPWPAALPESGAWRAHARSWRDRLLTQADLGSRLLAFAAAKS